MRRLLPFWQRLLLTIVAMFAASWIVGLHNCPATLQAWSVGAHHVVPAVRRTLAARMSMPMSIVADELCALILKAQTDARMDAGADAVSACARSCQPQGGIDPRSKRRACLLTRRFLPDLRPLPKTSESCHFQTWRGVAKASPSALVSASIEPRGKSAGARTR